MTTLYIDLTDYIVIQDKEKYYIQTNKWESFPTYYTGSNCRRIVDNNVKIDTTINNTLVWKNVYCNLKYFYKYKVAYIKKFPWKKL